jgi:hypothetical protein
MSGATNLMSKGGKRKDIIMAKGTYFFPGGKRCFLSRLGSLKVRMQRNAVLSVGC